MNTQMRLCGTRGIAPSLLSGVQLACIYSHTLFTTCSFRAWATARSCGSMGWRWPPISRVCTRTCFAGFGGGGSLPAIGPQTQTVHARPCAMHCEAAQLGCIVPSFFAAVGAALKGQPACLTACCCTKPSVPGVRFSPLSSLLCAAVGANLQDQPACLTAAPLKDKYDGIAISGETC